ncbi:sushi, von Willebrand factor type A, EGF and pentraxin domain-containing protein 1 [Latimeria chalumnae]|uniref:sushi, von Willebrand factor type A, EGF and pentraxin domain-containing protein 1 n=1 Tax=Latimeria chalumnae TaxID=7897 RepID=UPI00313CC1C4
MTGSWVTFLGFITISLVAFHSNALSKVAHVCTTCHANATCQNKSDGKPTCICNYGFVGNGRTFCQDKDECQIGTEKICGNHTACHNTHGGFYCTCLKGYHPSNDMTTFIPNDGTYCAAVDCGTPSTLSSSVVHLRKSTTFGSKVTYTCKEGFIHKSGNDTSVCSADGLWVGADLVCEAVDCGIPPNISNTLMHFAGNATYRSKVVYQCQPGYTGENMSSVCTAAGWWESSGLVCKAVDCGIPPNISNALTHFAGISTFGNKVVYQCQPGYTGGNKSSVCTAAGRWENVSLVCEAVDCGIPPNISNALTHFAGISTFGNKVVYQSVDCGIPPNISNALIRFVGNSTYGNKVVYQCQLGYTGGNISSVCTAAGQWERVSLVCKAVDCETPPNISNALMHFAGNTTYGTVDCGIPPNISNALMHFAGNTTYGSKIVYQCQPGYFGGNESSLCTAAGQWERVSLACKEVDCGSPPLILHADILWNGATGLGKVDCGKPPLIPHIDILWNGTTGLGSVAHYKCEPGFHRLRGRTFSFCMLNGQWEDITLVCKEINCGCPPVIEHADLVWDNTSRVGSVVYYRCKEEFMKVGGKTFSVCTEGGVWEKGTLICEVPTPTVSAEITTSASEPEMVDVQFIATEGQLQPLILRRAEDKNGPISLYQVVVFPLCPQCVFDCSLLSTQGFYNSSTDTGGYVAAEFRAEVIVGKLTFSIGDRQYYGEFYNAPLERGKDYYIILRTISEWNMDQMVPSSGGTFLSLRYVEVEGEPPIVRG